MTMSYGSNDIPGLGDTAGRSAASTFGQNYIDAPTGSLRAVLEGIRQGSSQYSAITDAIKKDPQGVITLLLAAFAPETLLKQEGKKAAKGLVQDERGIVWGGRRSGMDYIADMIQSARDPKTSYPYKALQAAAAGDVTGTSYGDALANSYAPQPSPLQQTGPVDYSMDQFKQPAQPIMQLDLNSLLKFAWPTGGQ